MNFEMDFSRVLAMPHHETHKIPPIGKLMEDYIIDNPGTWLDPFAKNCQLADYTNDLDENTNATDHMDFRIFLNGFVGLKIKGVILDPPYSPYQIKKHYDDFGLHFAQEDSRGFYSHTWDWVIKLRPDIVIQCGWTTVGRSDYYDVTELMVVCHSGNHHDTLVSVHRRSNFSLTDFL
jgi:hypothetical protein